MKRRYFLVCIAIIAFALAATAWLWPRLPQAVPLHWNASGVVDRYGERWELLVFGPGMMLMTVLLFALLPWLSPKRFDVADSGSAYLRIMLFIVAAIAYIHGVLLWANVAPELDVGRMVLAGASVLIALIGNLLGKLRRNFYVGIRTPWTLADEANWYATHRFAGKTMTISGLLCLVLVLVNAPFWLWIALLLAGTLAPVAYSLWYAKRATPAVHG